MFWREMLFSILLWRMILSATDDTYTQFYSFVDVYIKSKKVFLIASDITASVLIFKEWGMEPETLFSSSIKVVIWTLGESLPLSIVSQGETFGKVIIWTILTVACIK